MSGGTQPFGRRVLFRRAAALAATASPLAAALVAQQPESPAPLAGQADAGTLRDPVAAGRSRAPTGVGDNDETIKRIEHQLKCTCGCNLDIFTCRTTDFTCTYSPELHREVVALSAGGRTPQEVIDAFVAKYGERVLMAPKPVDFNLVGYLLPGAAVLAGGAALAWVIGRRAGAGGRAGGQGASDTTSGASAADRRSRPIRPFAHPPIRPRDRAPEPRPRRGGRLMLWEAAAAAGVGLLVLWLVLAPLRSTMPTALEADEPLEPDEAEETPRGAALAALKEIEFDRATDKLADGDYAELKARYTAEAVAAMRAEDARRRVDDVEAMIAARTRGLRDGASAACAACGPRPEADAVFCSNCGRPL